MVVHETAHKTALQAPRAQPRRGQLSAFTIALPYEYYCLFSWDHLAISRTPTRSTELCRQSRDSDAQLAIRYSGLMQVAPRGGLMLGMTGRKGLVPWIPRAKRVMS